MTPTFGISRAALNEIVRRGIWHVQHQTGVPYRQIGLLAGYRSGKMIEAVMSRDDVLPGPLALVALSQLFSFHDFDALADAMSSEGKRTLPVPVHFEGLLNGAILDEFADNGEALGHCLALFREGCLEEAEGRVRLALGALYQMLAEIEARRRGTLTTTGEALPSRPLAEGLAA